MAQQPVKIKLSGTGLYIPHLKVIKTGGNQLFLLLGQVALCFLLEQTHGVNGMFCHHSVDFFQAGLRIGQQTQMEKRRGVQGHKK